MGDLAIGTTEQTTPKVSGLRQQPFNISSHVYGLAGQVIWVALG